MTLQQYRDVMVEMQGDEGWLATSVLIGACL